MRAPRSFLVLVCIMGVAGFDVPRKLEVSGAGTPSEKVAALWGQTRTILLADAAEPLSDAQAMARGAPLIQAWTALETSLAGSDAEGEARAVLKLLNDFYGRPDAPQARRVAQRNDVRGNFGQRLGMVDTRVSR